MDNREFSTLSQSVAANRKDHSDTNGLASCDWFETQPNRLRHERFLRNVIEILLKDAVFEGTERHTPVIEWIEPEKLAGVLRKELPQDPKDEGDLMQLVKDVVRYSVKTGHPRFINQLFSR